MRTQRLGRSPVRVTELGFGAAAIGNLYQAVDDETARRAVDAAWQAGIRYFDTAPHYGLGLSERRLGAALAERPRDDFTVSTKVGRLLIPTPETAHRTDKAGFDVPADHTRRWDFSADGVRRSLESSLDRLGLDRVDLVLIHDPDEHWRPAVEEAYPALHELRDQGVVGAIGVGMNQWQMLERFVTETDVDTVLVAGRYTLLDQSAAHTLLPRCRERGVSVLAAGVFNGGTLATDDPGRLYDYRPIPDAVRDRASRLAEVCRSHGVTLPQAALAFTARHPAVASLVVGAQTAAQVTRNVDLAGAPVPNALWRDLAAAGLVPA
ncbi:aldo/keto reductase [Micromonospora acroterricola]|uniref:Aldo/keto reductase n=1 Tax=Micromonospora acroterricola TaxID=2202421 RepID=A0A317D2G0_9ACTN|nr:aldo/keto reductase [Micromonospora acroterricola]PWR08757.1 aldo/keto reductase [Micromonospora acroterricola]